ncbi:hypothetical protein [Rhodospirillaceae bacterium SYSU D60014]|jgi:hypothetical protein|uniref:hypothetical protein n=1 Tax=Virgifigura deserti TaxID=2268457 RepID=UPI000E668537
MNILEQLPAMDDQQLANLRDNAERLSANGDDKQKSAAVLILEAARQEIGTRSAAKRKAAAERKASTAKAAKAARAKAV